LRRSNWTPSIVPRGDDHDVYLVVDDLGRLGRVWREADYEMTDFETVVNDLLTGQYSDAVHVVCFNARNRLDGDLGGRHNRPDGFGDDAVGRKLSHRGIPMIFDGALVEAC
jgi:hypothetical protein